MSMYLVRSTQVFRADSENEAQNFIDEQKSKYNILKYSSELKTVKQKGEVVDEYYKVTLVKEYNSEKDPIYTYVDNYPGTDSAFAEAAKEDAE